MLRWIETLPDEQLLEYPELVVGGATAALLVGQATLMRRRLLALAARAERERPERYTVYVECVAEMVSAAAIDDGVADAVVAGHGRWKSRSRMPTRCSWRRQPPLRGRCTSPVTLTRRGAAE